MTCRAGCTPRSIQRLGEIDLMDDFVFRWTFSRVQMDTSEEHAAVGVRSTAERLMTCKAGWTPAAVLGGGMTCRATASQKCAVVPRRARI